MHELTLEWQEARQLKRETIRHQQRSKSPGSVRLGRDPVRCDVVLSDPTVSGLHIEIFFNASTQSFGLRNLRETNPPLVDGRPIIHGETPLSEGSTIYLGQLKLKVATIAHTAAAPSPGIAPTILMPPKPLVGVNQPVQASVSYGLQCPNCRRVSPFDQMDFGCHWCGTSLAAAASVLMQPKGN